VKVFVPGELLANEARTPNSSIGIPDQAAVSGVVEQGLPKPKDHQRIKPAANRSQHEGGQDRAADFRKELIHNLSLKLKRV
jgi:hypothetical protein